MTGEATTITESPVPATSDAGGNDVMDGSSTTRRRRWAAAVAVALWTVGLFVPFEGLSPMGMAVGAASASKADVYFAAVSHVSPIAVTTETGRQLTWHPNRVDAMAGYTFEEVAGLCSDDGIIVIDAGRYRLECPSLELTNLYQQSDDGVRDPVGAVLVDAHRYPRSIIHLGAGAASRMLPAPESPDIECWLPDRFDPADGALVEVSCTRAPIPTWIFMLLVAVGLWSAGFVIVWSGLRWLVGLRRRHRSDIDVAGRPDVEGCVAGGR